MQILSNKENHRRNLNFVAVCQHTDSVCVCVCTDFFFFKQETALESKHSRVHRQEHLL